MIYVRENYEQGNMDRETDNNRNNIEPSQLDDGSHTQSEKSNQHSENEDLPPLVTATLLATVSEIILNDAQAIQDTVIDNVMIWSDEVSSGSLPPEVISSRISNSYSSYITVSTIPSQENQQDSLVIPHHIVQIDMIKDQEAVLYFEEDYNTQSFFKISTAAQKHAKLICLLYQFLLSLDLLVY